MNGAPFVERLLLAEFQSPQALENAILKVRPLGSYRMDAFTPYPVASLELALGLKPSRLGFWILGFALLGAVFAFVVQYWLLVHAYPLLVAGMPNNAWPAFVPITFETMVLFGSLAGFFGFLARTRLPRLWHPTFEAPEFQSASIDGFWLSVDAQDAHFDEQQLTQLLMKLGANRVIKTWEPA